MATAILELGNITVDKLTEPSGGPTSVFGDFITAPGIDSPASSVLNLATTNATAINIGHSGLSTYVYGNSLFIGQNLDTISVASMYIGGINATDVYINSGANFHVLGDGYFENNLILDGYTINLSDGASNGQILQYNGSKWVAGVLNGTGIFPGSISLNQVAYGSGTNTITGSANLTFDGTHLGIGAAASTYPVEITGDGYLTSRLIINSSSASVSPNNTGAIRFHSGHLEFSENGGSWTQFGTGGSGMSIGSPVTSGVGGSILYVDNSNNLAQDNANFYWDATNHRLGIGTTSPSQKLDVNGHIKIDGYVIDLSGGATANQVIQYNGTNFIPATINAGVTIGNAVSGGTNNRILYVNGSSNIDDILLSITSNELGPVTDNTISLGDSSHRFVDGYFSGKIVLDGYNLDLSAGATNHQFLQYNGTSFVAVSGLTDKANSNELLLTTTGATTVVTYTPSTSGNFAIFFYYRVITATTNLTLSLAWTDVTGAQTQTLASASQATGSYSGAPFYFNSTASTSITLTATGGTANQIYISADIVRFS